MLVRPLIEYFSDVWHDEIQCFILQIAEELHETGQLGFKILFDYLSSIVFSYSAHADSSFAVYRCQFFLDLDDSWLHDVLVEVGPVFVHDVVEILMLQLYLELDLSVQELFQDGLFRRLSSHILFLC